MSRRWPPLGFAVLALAFALTAVLLFLMLLATPPEHEPRLLVLALRFATACTATLAGVLAVALWRVEAWAGRAVWRWALSSYVLAGAGVPFIGRITVGEWLFLMLIFLLTGGTAIFLVGAYVHYRLRTLPARLRRPVP